MRIIAGTYGGRLLAAPKTRNTRPMTDKVRAALFDILGPIDGFMVLDAYAGSGALGFEALSRGATRVTAIEMGREAVRAIQQNIEQLDVDFQYELRPERVEAWLARVPEVRYDLIFWMPPYDLLDSELLGRAGRLLKPDGVLVMNLSRHDGTFEPNGLRLIDTRSWGDPMLAFYKPA